MGDKENVTEHTPCVALDLTICLASQIRPISQLTMERLVELLNVVAGVL